MAGIPYIFFAPFWQAVQGVNPHMSHKKKDAHRAEEIRVDPAQRLCSKFDSTSIAQFPVAPDGAMGVRVVGDCAEEHMM